MGKILYTDFEKVEDIISSMMDSPQLKKAITRTNMYKFWDSILPEKRKAENTEQEAVLLLYDEKKNSVGCAGASHSGGVAVPACVPCPAAGSGGRRCTGGGNRTGRWRRKSTCGKTGIYPGRNALCRADPGGAFCPGE